MLVKRHPDAADRIGACPVVCRARAAGGAELAEWSTGAQHPARRVPPEPRREAWLMGRRRGRDSQ